MADHLPPHELGDFLSRLQQAALKSYSNSERTGCPGPQILREVARTSVPSAHPAYEHVKKCSPCLQEMLEMQGKAIQDERARAVARARMQGVLAGCVSVCLVVALGVYLVARRDVDAVKQPTQQRAVLPVVAATVALDFRSAAVRRGGGDEANTGSLPQLPRKVVALEIILPFGSDDGTYSIEIRDLQKDAVLKSASGAAKLLDGETRLTIPRMDLSDLSPGECSFLFRHADANWRRVKIAVQ